MMNFRSRWQFQVSTRVAFAQSLCFVTLPFLLALLFAAVQAETELDSEALCIKIIIMPRKRPDE